MLGRLSPWCGLAWPASVAFFPAAPALAKARSPRARSLIAGAYGHGLLF